MTRRRVDCFFTSDEGEALIAGHQSAAWRACPDLRAMVVVDVKWWRLLKSQSQLKFCFRHQAQDMPVYWEAQYLCRGVMMLAQQYLGARLLLTVTDYVHAYIHV